MTIEQILKIEPRLQIVIDYAKRQNELAKYKNINWHNVWADCKFLMRNKIGWYAKNELLSSSDHWETFYNYLYSITKNTK